MLIVATLVPCDSSRKEAKHQIATSQDQKVAEEGKFPYFREIQVGEIL